MSNNRIVLWSLLAGLAVAVLLSPFASPWPDGLEKVADDKGFLGRGENSVLSSPVPDYTWPGVRHQGLATSLAGLLGTLVVFGVGWGVQKALAGKK